MDFSLIKYYGEQNSSTCGYCKGKRSSFSHGMHAYMLSTQDYQDLIDRGWRRSGQYCYKPNMEITCCPCYTIKCATDELKLSKSHKKILKRVNKFLKDGIKEKTEDNIGQSSDAKACEDTEVCREVVDIPNVAKADISREDISSISRQVNNATCDIALKRFKCHKNDEVAEFQTPEVSVEKNVDQAIKHCKKAKQIRLERKRAKLEAQGLTLDLEKHKNKNVEKSLNDYLNESSENDRHKLKIILVPSYEGSTPQGFDLYHKYQAIIHKDPPQKITKSAFEKFLCKSPLKIKLLEVRSRECLANLKETYALYEKYQQVIHRDPPSSLKDFLGFLQQSPIKFNKPQDGPPEGYGSFHQQYWLDDKLIAVGVIDILPYCLSSVYFFYDPDYSFLSLGTYGSLREIDLVQKLSQTVPLLKYYYMGFYIHSCPKMKYKGKLSSSYLLCPEKYTWHPLNDEMRKKLDQKKYQVFNDNLNYNDEEEFTRHDVKKVLILVRRNSCIPYLEYKRMTGENLEPDLLEYGCLVGKTCAHRIVYSVI